MMILGIGPRSIRLYPAVITATVRAMVKAAVCREFGVLLSIEDITVSAPGPGEARVEVNPCAICHSDTSSHHPSQCGGVR